MEADRLVTFRRNAISSLLSARNSSGHWEGELSDSAFSTATAIVALRLAGNSEHHALVENGADWLIINQNGDGGWGDTPLSFSHILTTLACWSALALIRGPEIAANRKAEAWIRDYAGSLDPARLAETVKACHGRDRNLSVPILMHCAICGTLGKNGWRLVPALPYEWAAALPRDWLGILQLPTVSYALPALIAIGKARFERRRSLAVSPACWLRRWSWERASRLLCQMQPESGGYLEAAPLTSFVAMALASAGKADHPAARAAIRFLVQKVRSVGSWPIGADLSTWATTLSINALHAKPPGAAPSRRSIASREEKIVLRWLLDQQYLTVHPVTDSPPGGWAWTDLPGGVPDAGDTPGAMLALHELTCGQTREEGLRAARRAAIWLIDLQNRDGGIPTFCRGWGTLPFDRSSPDLTAQTLRAWQIWRADFAVDLRHRVDHATAAGLKFIGRCRESDGSWTPLWFGNQHRSRDEANPVYGTAMVCRALETLAGADHPTAQPLWMGGLRWLKKNQNPDGGWGGGLGTPSTIEETALALAALAPDRSWAGLGNGFSWLENATRNGTRFPPSPIGLCFAKVWYSEKIYSMAWTVEALNRFAAEF